MQVVIRTTVMFLLALVACRLGSAQQFSRGDTINPHFKLARFHAAWIFSGFDQPTLNSVQNQLQDLQFSFNESFQLLREDARQLNFAVTNEPAEGLLKSGRILQQADIDAVFSSLEGKVEQDGVIFVYILAHGQHNTLQFGAGGASIPRQKIVERLQAIQTRKQARLVVLLTDNCMPPPAGAITGSVPDGSETNPAEAGGARSREQMKTSAVWRALYFGHVGFVDLTSTTSGFGFLKKGNGGYTVLTKALKESFNLQNDPEVDDLYEQGEFKDANDLFAKKMEERGSGKNPNVIEWRGDFDRELKVRMKTAYDNLMVELQRTDPATYAQMSAQKKQEPNIKGTFSVRPADK